MYERKAIVYSQEDFEADTVKFEEVQRSIPGLDVQMAGGSAPFQAEGTLQGFPFYFRYRGGTATLRIGEEGSTDTPVMNNVLYSSSLSHGGYYDGSLSETEFATLMRQLVASLSVAPFSWAFLGNKVEFGEDADGAMTFTGTDRQQRYSGWGHTAEEAYSRIHDYLDSFHLTEEQVRALTALENVSSTPINADTRVFPDTPPTFTVLSVPERR